MSHKPLTVGYVFQNYPLIALRVGKIHICAYCGVRERVKKNFIKQFQSNPCFRETLGYLVDDTSMLRYYQVSMEVAIRVGYSIQLI